MSQADVAQPVSGMGLEQDQVRIVGAKTFVRSERAWMDTAFDPQIMVTQKVAFLSPQYFALAASRLEAGAALALGERVIVVVDGTAYEVVAEDSPTEVVELPEVVSEVMPGLVKATAVVGSGQTQPEDRQEGNSLGWPCSSAGLLLAAGMWVLLRRV